jgi:outer membrane protein
MNVIRKTICLLFITLIATPCLAATNPPSGPPAGIANPDTNRFSVGIAVIVGESPYYGADPRVIPVPILSYRGPRFQLTGLRASYRLLQYPYGSLASIAQWRFSPFDSNDSSALRGMQDRPHTVDAGLRLSGPRFLPLDTGIEVRGDPFGVHDGIAASLDIGWRFRRKQGFIRPGIRTEWLSPELSVYLYGVSPEEALPDRPAYSPDGSWQTSADIMFVRSFSSRWEFTALAGMTFLDSAATDSPIVDKSAVWRTMAGFGYRF